jgi:hypothetical protein
MKGLLWLLSLAAVLPVNVLAQGDGSSAAASSPLTALLAQLPHCAVCYIRLFYVLAMF